MTQSSHIDHTRRIFAHFTNSLAPARIQLCACVRVRLAGCAAVVCGRVMDRADMAELYLRKRPNRGFDGSRFLELGVKYGAARLERHARYMRSLINQLRTTTVSNHVLVCLLKWKSERTPGDLSYVQ